MSAIPPSHKTRIFRAGGVNLCACLFFLAACAGPTRHTPPQGKDEPGVPDAPAAVDTLSMEIPLPQRPIPEWDPQPPSQPLSDAPGLVNGLGLPVKKRPAGIGDSISILMAEKQDRVRLRAAGDAALWEKYRSGWRVVKRLHGDFALAWRGGRWELQVEGRNQRGSGEELALRPMSPHTRLELEGKAYRGEFRLIPSGGVFAVVNRLPVEDYLRGVLPAEMGKLESNALEALKAQAVVARTYAYKRMQRSTGRDFHLYSDIRDQVYAGASREYPLSDHAVLATAGLAVVHADTLAHCFYYSTCSGKTAAYHEVWSGPSIPYLQSMPDLDENGKTYCSASRFSHWEETWDMRALPAVVRANLRAAGVGNPPAFTRVDDVRILTRDGSGRVAHMEILTDGGPIVVRGDKTRWALKPASKSYSILPSAWFNVGREGDKLVARGKAFGHGIGLCQMGAMERSRRGQDFVRIIKSYYAGVEIAELR